MSTQAQTSSPQLQTFPVSRSNRTLETLLKQDLAAREGVDFNPILKKWEQLYGTGAVPVLLRIVATREIADTDRYVALMSATKLGGHAIAPAVVPFLADPSWMIRSGALRALRVLKNAETTRLVLPLLEDPSLVVRREAVETIRTLQPIGAAKALVRALYSKDNYYNGKAFWVPQAALEALTALHAKEVIPDLKPLLLRCQDPDLQRKTIQSLEKLSGRTLSSQDPLTNQALAWEKYITATSPLNNRSYQ